MDLQYYDSNGHLAQGPSTGQLERLNEYADNEPDAVELADFLENGQTEDIGDLQAELKKLTPANADVRSMLNDLISACDKAEDVLILSGEDDSNDE